MNWDLSDIDEEEGTKRYYEIVIESEQQYIETYDPMFGLWTRLIIVGVVALLLAILTPLTVYWCKKDKCCKKKVEKK